MFGFGKSVVKNFLNLDILILKYKEFLNIVVDGKTKIIKNNELLNLVKNYCVALYLLLELHTYLVPTVLYMLFWIEFSLISGTWALSFDWRINKTQTVSQVTKTREHAHKATLKTYSNV